MKLSKLMSIAFCSMAVCLLFTDFAAAQRGRGGRGGAQTVERYQLASLAEVATELKLTDDQKKAAADSIAKVQEEDQALRGGGGDPAENAAKLTKIRAEHNDKLVAMLNAEQKARLNGLYIQANPGAALSDAAIVKELGLSADQIAKLAKVTTDNAALAQAAFQGGAPDPDAMAKIRTEAEAALMKVLTDEQKTKLTALKGKDLTMDLASLRGRGGNRAGRRGNAP